MESDQDGNREGMALRVIGRVHTPFDIPDGTPLLDVKPWAPELDASPTSKAGWLDARGADRRVADGRFHG